MLVERLEMAPLVPLLLLLLLLLEMLLLLELAEHLDPAGAKLVEQAMEFQVQLVAMQGILLVQILAQAGPGVHLLQVCSPPPGPFA